MKRIILFSAKTILIITLSIPLLIGCGKDEPKKPDDPGIDMPTPDPEGTLTHTFYSYEDGDDFYLHTYFPLMLESKGLYSYKSFFALDSPSIITVGEIKGLGKIVKLPDNCSWSLSAEVKVNYGYIVKMSDDVFARIFVTDWKEETITKHIHTYDGVIYYSYKKYTCIIKYQYPFQPK